MKLNLTRSEAHLTNVALPSSKSTIPGKAKLKFLKTFSREKTSTYLHPKRKKKMFRFPQLKAAHTDIGIDIVRKQKECSSTISKGSRERKRELRNQGKCICF